MNEIASRVIEVLMPSQHIKMFAWVEEEEGVLDMVITYTHPTSGEIREVKRMPNKRAFSQKHFDKELEAYITQEAMSDLMDNRHSYDWVE